MELGFAGKAALEEAQHMERILSTISPDLVIPYSEFVVLMVPLLRDVGPNFNTTEWLRLVRNEAVPLRIISDETGETMYTLPPLVGNVPYVNNGGYLGNAAKNLRNIMAQDPVGGASVLYTGLSKLSPSDEATEQAMVEYVTKLNVILVAHQIEPIALKQPSVVDAEAKLADDDVIGYDLV